VTSFIEINGLLRLFFKRIKKDKTEKNIEQEWPDYKIVNKSVFVQIQLRLLEYTHFDYFQKNSHCLKMIV
jgi:hypothetical protein